MLNGRVLASTRNLPRTVLCESTVEHGMWVSFFSGQTHLFPVSNNNARYTGDPSCGFSKEGISWRLDMWPWLFPEVIEEGTLNLQEVELAHMEATL